MDLCFSKRRGITPAKKSLQIDSMDDDLRNCLWNIIKINFIDLLLTDDNYTYKGTFNTFFFMLWLYFFKNTVDTKPIIHNQMIDFIREFFFKCKWYTVYNFLEFIVNFEIKMDDKNKFVNYINFWLESEYSAYRFVDGIIAPITNSTEITEIEEAINQPENFTALTGVNTHLTAALKMLSDRKDPDYRNSVKESISAVETTCRILTDKNTLGKALSSLEANGITINNQLKEGFNKIYAYTNDPDTGIRHSMIEGNYIPDFADAKFMLVSCSAFVNYLISKRNIIKE